MRQPTTLAATAAFAALGLTAGGITNPVGSAPAHHDLPEYIHNHNHQHDHRDTTVY